MDVFTPPRPPSTSGTSAQTKPRMISTTFGDGYVQDTPDGSNPNTRSWTLSWDPLQPSEASSMVAFLDAHVGQPFYFTIPGDVAPRTVVQAGYSTSYPSPTTMALTLQLQERFVY